MSYFHFLVSSMGSIGHALQLGFILIWMLASGMGLVFIGIFLFGTLRRGPRHFFSELREYLNLGRFLLIYMGYVVLVALMLFAPDDIQKVVCLPLSIGLFAYAYGSWVRAKITSLVNRAWRRLQNIENVR
jgi:hypothetical protein